MAIIRGLLSILKDFANWSTVAAVPHVANAHSMFSRIFWLFIFILMLVIFIIQLSSMLKQFFAWPSQINTNIFYDTLPFPAMTICNANPYKMSQSSAEVQAIMQDYTLVAQGGTTSNYGFDKAANEFEMDMMAWDAMALAVAATGAPAASLYTFSEMIVSCTVAGIDCGSSNVTWSTIQTPRYGLCHTAVTSQKATQPGLDNGVKIVVYVAAEDNTLVNKDYLPVTRIAGVQLSLDQPGTYPALASHSKIAGAGYETLVSMSYSKTRRAKKPYGKCLDTEPAGTNLYTNYTYTEETCFLGCRQRETIKQCGCAHARYNKGASDSWCSATTTNLQCLATLRGDQKATGTQKNINVATDCGCHPACASEAFAASLSRGGYPVITGTLATDVTAKAGSCPNTWNPVKCNEWYGRNLLILQIYYSALNYDVFEEVAAYSLGAMVNDLGGQAGLWLGLSIVSVVEMVGLLILLLLFCISGGNIKVRPEEKDLYMDERIQAVDSVKNEIDQAEAHQIAYMRAARRRARGSIVSD